MLTLNLCWSLDHFYHCLRPPKWPLLWRVDKEKALKQVVEANLNEKTLELNAMEWRATIVERARDLAKQRAEGLQGKLGEAEIKLTEATSIVSTYDKELADLKETMKTCSQVYYNMGFKYAENLAGVVVLQARRFGFVKG